MNPTAFPTFFSIVFVLALTPGDAPAEKAETEFSAMLTNATLKGSWAPITGGAQGEEQGDGYQIVSATKKEGDTWVIVSKVWVNEKWMEFPMEMTVKFAGDTAVLILDEVPTWGGGTYSARVMFHNDVYAGSWWGGEQKGTISGTITRADKVGGRGTVTVSLEVIEAPETSPEGAKSSRLKVGLHTARGEVSPDGCSVSPSAPVPMRVARIECLHFATEGPATLWYPEQPREVEVEVESRRKSLRGAGSEQPDSGAYPAQGTSRGADLCFRRKTLG